ncbi:hypothetical protein FRC03_002451 [Tulasnella sp. 419]|nr:hypothetical protein FRC03_002451 [Tulasnella sp. 419]
MGGDGFSYPNWHIVYWKAQNSLVIVHEGTSIEKIASIAVDLRFRQKPLDPNFFPNAPSTARVHSGFQKAFSATARDHLEQIKKYLEGVRVDGDHEGEYFVYHPTSVVIVGYSMGAAVALLNALYLREQLPAHISIRTISIGSPMVGNWDFARWADQLLAPIQHNNIRIANKLDIVPRITKYIPHYKYFHTGIEYHVQSDGRWINCGTQENYGEDPRCSAGFRFNDKKTQDHYFIGPLSMLDVCDRVEKLSYWHQW